MPCYKFNFSDFSYFPVARELMSNFTATGVPSNCGYLTVFKGYEFQFGGKRFPLDLCYKAPLLRSESRKYHSLKRLYFSGIFNWCLV